MIGISFQQETNVCISKSMVKDRINNVNSIIVNDYFSEAIVFKDVDYRVIFLKPVFHPENAVTLRITKYVIIIIKMF
jgi:hypothetical protein